MKATGIVRKVDELGRIVLPIELRRTLDIEIKDPLEIMVFTRKCEALRFRASDVSLYGTGAGGVKSINIKADDEVFG